MNSKVQCLSTHLVRREVEAQAGQLKRAIALIEHSRARTAALLASVDERLLMMGPIEVGETLRPRVSRQRAPAMSGAPSTGHPIGDEIRTGLVTLRGQARDLDNKLSAQRDMLQSMMARLRNADGAVEVPTL